MLERARTAEEAVIHHPRIDLGHPEFVAAEREYCSRKFVNYIKQAWPVIEPVQPYSHGWHIDAIAEHLEAVSAGHITRLMIAVPPGSMKSLSTAVFWPTWEWGALAKPHLRTVATSHSENLAGRDNLRAKRLVTSDWYQERWGDQVKITTDQKSKFNFENTSTGWRQASPFKSITGKRGDRVIIDDPLSVNDANSDAMREEANLLFDEAVPLRLNNPDKSAIIIIMQRLHENDLIGHILSRDLGYDYLMIPMRYEEDRTTTTSIGWTDPRTTEGQLMFEERFPEEVVKRDEHALGEYAAAGQFQQNPVPRKGGLFEVEKIGVIDYLPEDLDLSVRAWDLAGSAGKGAYTAGVRVAWSEKLRKFVIMDAVRDRLGAAGVRKMVKDVAEEDGMETPLILPKDPGQAGKVQAEDMTADLAGYSITVEAQTGSKEIRAEPLASQVNIGNVVVLKAPWNDAFINEMRFFPRGKYKDQVDAAASAFNELSRRKRRKKKVALKLVVGGEKQGNWVNNA